MVWLALIFCLAAAGWIVRRYMRLRYLVAELEDASRAKRRYLPRETTAELQALGIEGLIHELNDSIDRENHNELRKAGYDLQVQAILRAVQEVIIVFNADRKVRFANRAAERLFRNGQSIEGLRLEGVVRSLSLLELLENPGDSETLIPTQISIEQNNQTLWFEASCAHVRTQDTILLVMHDISRLKQLEVMRRDFVANVSHELRTPLTIIKGFAETLVDDDAALKPESRTRFLGKILDNSDRLNFLVEDLLTLSRLESKPEQVELTPDSLHDLLEETVENFKSRLNESTQILELSFDPKIDRFSFDRFQMNQVFDNLIENAFRYAPDFTKLAISVELDPGGEIVTCAVSDNGPGIPERDLPHIFERFYRVDKGRSRERGGTGLGLSIVKHIIQIHGGTIRAESMQGQGTTIILALPYLAEKP